MSRALEKKIAVVTGASSGIGEATALELARLGAAVVVNARREERLAGLVRRIESGRGRAFAVTGDMRKFDDIDRLARESTEFSRREGRNGQVDILIANAGRGLAGGVLTSDPAQWQELFELNVIGLAMQLRRFAEVMMPFGSGDIVAIGSAVGVHISPFSGVYGATKFAVGALAEALRREIASKGVRVTLVKPGLVRSEFQAVAGYTEENFYRNVERFGRMLEPAEVAQAIGFTVSQPASVHVNDLLIRPTRQDYP